MLLAFLLIFLLGCIIAVIFSINALINTLKHGLPYVSTPDWAIEWLAKNLVLSKNDTVYELGCGDARVLAGLAYQHPSTQFIGIEIQWWPFILGKFRTRKLPNVRLIYGDLFKQDVSPATVVYGFFITGFMPKLATKLKENLRPGTKIYSYGFRLPAWTTVQEVQYPDTPAGSRLLLYRR